MKDAQATVEASRPQTKTSSTSKHGIYALFYTFVGHFAYHGSWYSRPKSMPIHEDPDPQHYCNVYEMWVKDDNSTSLLYEYEELGFRDHNSRIEEMQVSERERT